MSDLPQFERVVGSKVGSAAGATLIVVGGIHGNEPAGLLAARRVFATLERKGVEIRGELVCFGGNLGAMSEGKRYRLRDMNRVWSVARVAELAQKEERDYDVEDHEQLDLLTAITAAIARARGPVFLIDLHTTSAHGIPFVLFGDTLAQRGFASALPLPLILGLEEQLDGVLSDYGTRLGCVTYAVEGGQHADPASVDNLEAVIWLAAESAGIVRTGSVSELRTSHALLEQRRGDLPRVMEVVSRHAITPEDAFVMEPGFRNLDRARAGQLLATDRRGPIRAPHDGVVMLPLYQGQGADGFFWGREVSPARLRASEALRHMHLDRFLDLLPGISRDVTDPARFLLDPDVAGLYPRAVFHLLGYRRIREGGRRTTVERSSRHPGGSI